MRQKHILVILLAFVASVLQAAQVNKNDALQKAERFVAGRQAAARGAVGQTMSLKTALDNPYYYVFNIGSNGGFVIVSGDDRTPEILGYSDQGSFDAQNIPDNMRAFLQGYADEIQHLPANVTAASRGVGQKKAAVRSSITPLLTTLWNQHAPYNNNCPIVSSKRTLTGCVATAMAQVMNFHQYPVEPTTVIPGYTPTGSNAGPEVDPLEETTFDWGLMRNEYDGADTDDAADEVAKLMQYCGASVQMNYGVDGSEASTSMVINALINYFDYDAGARYAERSEYDYNGWVALLYTELANNRPVLMGGQSTGGGHAFVCDGYDEDDFFHINWGWGGTSNGFFRLSNLTPDTQGAGGSSTNDGYNLSLGACVGVQKNIGTVPTNDLKLTVSNMQILDYVQNNTGYYVNSKTYNRSNTASPFYAGVGSYFTNYTGLTRTFAYGWRLKKDGVTIWDFVYSEGSSFSNNSYTGPGVIDNFGALEDGTYRLVAICKLSGTDSWVECIDADKSYIEAVVNGLTLTMNAVNVVPAEYHLAVTNITLGAGGLVVGQASSISFNVTNSGTADYHGDITLVLGTENFGGQTVDIKAGETKSVTITSTPSAEGAFSLTIYDGLFEDGTPLGVVSSVTVYAGSSSASIDFSELTINNSSGRNVYGNAISGSVKVRNTGTTTYKQGISVILGKTYGWEETEPGSGSWTYYYYEDFTKNVNDQIVASGEETIDFNFNGLEYGERYVLLLVYYTYDSTKGKVVGTPSNRGIYTIQHGFVTVDADGNVTATAPAANVVVPTNAVAVDLRGQATVTNVTPNANPNVVYLLDDEAAVPTGVTGNVVKGDVAPSIALSDGYDFNTPIAFTAGTISYSRTFTDGTNATNGHWTTIILPFDVDKVEVDGVEKSWFFSKDDTNKHFWVKKFVQDGTGTVNFDYTDKIEANKPYIIAIPDNSFGAWSLVGKTLVFSGTSKSVSSEKAVTSGDHYKFVGTTTSTSPTNVFDLNADGTSFVYSTAAKAIAPFRAYFKEATGATASTALRITSPSNQTTSIGQLPAEIATPAAMPQEVYTLDGRRVSSGQMKKGVYIVGGKKVIK